MSEPMIDSEATPNAPMPGKALAEVIKIDETLIRGHLDKVVRESVQETLNALLDAEADQLCGARRYERSPERVDTRAGHYERQLHTKAGEVTLRVPKLRNVPFETAIIERYRRRESSVEEAMLEMYYAGVSMRRVEDTSVRKPGTATRKRTMRISSALGSSFHSALLQVSEGRCGRAQDMRFRRAPARASARGRPRW